MNSYFMPPPVFSDDAKCVGDCQNSKCGRNSLFHKPRQPNPRQVIGSFNDKCSDYVAPKEDK